MRTRTHARRSAATRDRFSSDLRRLRRLRRWVSPLGGLLPRSAYDRLRRSQRYVSPCGSASLTNRSLAVWCPGAVTTPRVADRRPGHLLSYSQEESRTFVGLDDECLESFCKAEGRTSLRSYQPADSALWPLPGYADEETRVHLRPATTTAAAGAAGRRRRPLCDLGTGNFTRPPLPFTTRFGYLSTPDTVRKPQRPRLDASYDFGHRSRIPHAWAPCGYQTRTLATLLPTCVYKLHRSRLTCMPCGEFVRDGLVTTLARCPAAHRSLD